MRHDGQYKTLTYGMACNDLPKSSVEKNILHCSLQKKSAVHEREREREREREMTIEMRSDEIIKKCCLAASNPNKVNL